LKKKQEFLDDGRVIAPMNVEGMPWHSQGLVQSSQSAGQLDRRQFRSAMWGALGAALTVAGILSAAIILFVLFCTKIWLK
jgi:hypothetical protein